MTVLHQLCKVFEIKTFPTEGNLCGQLSVVTTAKGTQLLVAAPKAHVAVLK
jgi:hypothetical protein